MSAGRLAAVAAIGVGADQAGEEEVFLGDAGAVGRVGVVVLAFVVRAARRPSDPRRVERMIEQMSGIASSPAIAIVAAGATLANPGGFIPLALKDISELNPSTLQFIGLWAAFALLSLLPLSLALLMLATSPERAQRLLTGARGWLERRATTVAGVILVLLAVVLLRNGIAGL